MPLRSVYITIAGRVQGVGFRYFASYKAEELNIHGWVKNTPDGKVEIEAEGEPDDVDMFVGWMKIGPARAIINSIHISEIPVSGYRNFNIR